MNDTTLTTIGITALQAAYAAHQNLGATGEERIATNQHGETALRVDVACEDAVISVLREHNMSVRIISEEHGVITLGGSPRYTAVLDGLDGSAVYQRSRGSGRYGTMFALFAGLEPRYQDYLFCGTMEHTAHKLCYANKNAGSVMLDGQKTIPLQCRTKTALDHEGLLYVDEYFEINKQIFSKPFTQFHTRYAGSSCIAYTDVAAGSADAALECTRKGNIELAVAYGLVREAGGVMVTLDATDVGEQRYHEFGQASHIPVITAANAQLAHDIITHVTV